MNEKIELGQKVKDIITGFEGIVMCKVDYLTSCTHYGIQGEIVDGKVPEYLYFDYKRLKIINKKSILERTEETKTKGASISGKIPNL
jgi:hypothetical protein